MARSPVDCQGTYQSTDGANMDCKSPTDFKCQIMHVFLRPSLKNCLLGVTRKKTFNQFFLIFTKQHFNDRCTKSDIVSAWQLPSHTRIKDNFQYRRYIQFAHRICEYFHQCFKCLSDSIFIYNSQWHVVFDKTNVSLTVC